MRKEENSLLKSVSRVVAIITFIADLITVGVFIKDILLNTLALTNYVSYVGIIVLAFGFAFLLWLYSKVGQPRPKLLYQLFSWLYIIYSAFIFGIISFRFIIERNYSFGDYIGYIFLVILVGGLGLGISLVTKMHRVGYFCFPFLLVALEQIILWLYKLISHLNTNFDLANVGNLFLFVIVCAIVLGLLSIKEKR
jgi:hypothetical protein